MLEDNKAEEEEEEVDEEKEEIDVSEEDEAMEEENEDEEPSSPPAIATKLAISVSEFQAIMWKLCEIVKIYSF